MGHTLDVTGSILDITATGPDLDPAIHGAKACGLQVLMRAGLDVPPGFVISIEAATQMEQGEDPTSLGPALSRLVQGVDDPRLAVRSGAAVSLPGALETILGVAPGSINEAVRSVAASAGSSRATAIAAALGLDAVPPTAVVVQVQLDPTVDDLSGAGAAASRDLITGWRHATGSFAWGVSGDRVMAGEVPVAPLDEIDGRCPAVLSRLRSDLASLDHESGGPVEVEFVIASGKLWYLQFRQLAVSGVESSAVVPFGGAIIGRGRPAAAGSATGRLTTSVDEALEAIDLGHSVVLALVEASPADVEAMVGSAAVLTVLGGPECHAAVVARSAGVPAVVSVGGLGVGSDHIMLGGRRFDSGAELMVDGTTGTIVSATVAP